MNPVAATPRRYTLAQRLVVRVSGALGAVRSRSRLGFRILLYHSVGSDVPEHTYGMSVRPHAFADQMRWLREESGCNLMSLEAGAAALAHRTLAGTAVAVTFDDGFLDVLTEAAPVLAKYEIPFTVFVVGGYLERPSVPRRYMDIAALRELAAVPHASIGAHGFTHRPLTRLDGSALDDEISRSRDALAMCLGRSPSAISYPHGAVNRRVMGRVEAAGFGIGVTSFVGVNQVGVHPLHLSRTEILEGDGLDEMCGKLRGDYDWYRLRQRVYWPLPS
jgi:peptidoglycan/xylan/chitin deacetylase (PgdA/CDA1 family)